LNRPKHIGIVAVSPEGSALCYRDIFRVAKKLIGDHGHPTVSLHNLPLEDYVRAVLRNDWHAVGEMLSRSARVLAAGGAEFCIVPDNLMQHGVHVAQHGSAIPWVTMTDLVADAIARDGRRVVGLIGTKLVMLGSTYQTVLGLRKVQVLIPDGPEADAVDDIIFRELIYGVVTKESQRRMLSVLEHLSQRGCEGVILGCTEAALMVSHENAPVPVYDAAELLAEGAVRYAIGQRL
jgi:aspartate racemase